MALNISPGGWRCNDVGQSDGLTVGRAKACSPIGDNRLSDFFECDRSPKHSGECGFSGTSSRFFLRSIKQDRAVLQEGIPFSDLCGADELPAVDDDLTANRHREARGRTVGRWDGGTVRSEACIYAQ